LDVQCNARTRVRRPCPAETSSVGFYTTNVRLDPLCDNKGFSPSFKFWNLARQAKQWTDSRILSGKSVAGIIYCHYKFRIEKKLDFTIHKSVLSDVVLSNLGRYPFSLVHDLGQHGNITVKGLHFCTSFPNLACCVGLFISSTDHLDYCMMNKLTDDDGATFFRYFVRAVEAISTIGADETIGEACQRILNSNDKNVKPRNAM
jgi:hypothetical protein